MVDVVVVGHVGRDLVLEVDDVPGPGAGASVRARQERAGGAVNQAVAARQLGLSAALVAAVGDDDAGTAVLADARADDIDVTGVVRRPGVPSALFVDVVPHDGARRLLEHVPESLGLTAPDVFDAAHLLTQARAVIVQAQQPSDAVREAVRIAADAGALVVLDGSTDRATLDDLLGRTAPGSVARRDRGRRPRCPEPGRVRRRLRRPGDRRRRRRRVARGARRAAAPGFGAGRPDGRR
jgi:ribokinase